jgi:hypothetical protein
MSARGHIAPAGLARFFPVILLSVAGLHFILMIGADYLLTTEPITRDYRPQPLRDLVGFWEDELLIFFPNSSYILVWGHVPESVSRYFYEFLYLAIIVAPLAYCTAKLLQRIAAFTSSYVYKCLTARALRWEYFSATMLKSIASKTGLLAALLSYLGISMLCFVFIVTLVFELEFHPYP